jgi:hypothetical protein
MCDGMQAQGDEFVLILRGARSAKLLFLFGSDCTAGQHERLRSQVDLGAEVALADAAREEDSVGIVVEVAEEGGELVDGSPRSGVAAPTPGVESLAGHLGPDWTATLETAWRRAYNLVAEIMMATTTDLGGHGTAPPAGTESE